MSQVEVAPSLDGIGDPGLCSLFQSQETWSGVGRAEPAPAATRLNRVRESRWHRRS